MDWMGELRSALHERPTENSWEHLTQLLERWPEEEELFERALPYAHGIIASWAEEILFDVALGFRAPPRWGRALVGALREDPARERLQRLSCLAPVLRLHFPWRRQKTSPAPATVVQLPMLTQVLEISRGDQESIRNVFGSLRFSRLTTLSLRRSEATITAEGMQAVLASLEEGTLLTMLELQGAWLRPEAARCIAAHPAFGDLVELLLDDDSFISEEAIELLLASESIPRAVLRELSSASSWGQAARYIYEPDYE